MAEGIVHITVVGADGTSNVLEAPTDIGLSLMEFLKANEYDILATCGGMALCATCCVDILSGNEKLTEVGDAEGAMLDTLPDSLLESRLACQIRISKDLEGLKLRLHHR